MEDPVTGDDPIRGGIAEEEVVARSYGAAFLDPPQITWRDGAQQRQPGSQCLIVAEGLAASVLMNTCVQSKQPVGQIDLRRINPKVATALPKFELDPHSATIYEVQIPDQQSPSQSEGMLLIICPKAVVPARAVAWTRAVLEALQPFQTAIISVMPAADFRGDGDAAEDVVLLTLSSTASKEAMAGCGIPMPSGGLLAGLPAAILGHCEVRGDFAFAMVGVQMSPVPDQVYLKGLVSGVERLLKRFADGYMAAAFNPAPASIRQAVIRCDRAYRGSAASLLYT